LYQQYYETPEQFTSLPKTLKEKISAQFGRKLPDGRLVFGTLVESDHLASRDGATQKTLFRLMDAKVIETVLMRYDQRRTLCISTQSGCAMGCTFCATGQMGFFRSLSSGEIVEQVLFYARQLHSQGEKVTNVVLMGMGEPFHNYEATLAAVDRMNHAHGLNLGARRFTISTVGLVPTIKRFTQEKRQVNLAVSLHAAEDKLRSSMLPVNRKYPLGDLLAACLDYVQQTRRRITFEWALIEGVNDTPEQAKLLAKRLQPFRIGGAALCHINAIPLNPTARYSGKATGKMRAQAFKSELEKMGIPCTIRLRRGIDIQAGCGQLAGAAAHTINQATETLS
jgi:23S rRNA (adenine2503-C2)-methyltransferase